MKPLFPVVENLTITSAIETDRGLELFGWFDKRRACVLDSFTVYTVDDEGGVKIIPVMRPAALDNGSFTDSFPNNRPVGHNYFGPWIISPVYVPEDDPFPIYVIYEHNCTDLWNTVSIHGPLIVSY